LNRIAQTKNPLIFHKKNILLISPEAWGKNYVSKHHYAKELVSRGALVYFLNPPSKANQVTEIEPNLRVVDYIPIFRGLALLPSFISQYLTLWEINTLESRNQCKFDIIWNFDSSRFFNLKKIADRLRICHIVDFNQNIQREMLAKTSDVCFCTSDYIKRELQKHSSKVYKIHHGYQRPEKTQVPVGNIEKNKVNVGIVGNLSRKCIDWPTVLSLISTFNNVHFHFLGSYRPSNLSNDFLDENVLNVLRQATNVTVHGEVESKNIHSYLSCFDILLCAYHIDTEADIAQHSNLHKIMEYLGSGKIVISSYVDEYNSNNDLLEMYKNSKEVEGLFRAVLNDLTNINSSQNSQKRIQFAESNSYQNQILRIDSILANLNYE
jgi:hypothetical protein